MVFAWRFIMVSCPQRNRCYCLWQAEWLRSPWGISCSSVLRIRWFSMSKVGTISHSGRVCFENVVQRFRLIQERPDTLREAFAHLFRKRVSYHDFEALKGISFAIREGETVAIVGRNGSGKSTILKIIAGVYRPTSGVVKVSGKVAALI